MQLYALGDVWYNIGHIGLAIGDTSLAYQCFRLALTADHSHAEAFNNLGVLEMRRGKVEQARAFFTTAAALAPHLFEPNHNMASLSEKTGDLQTAYVVVQVNLPLFDIPFDNANSSESFLVREFILFIQHKKFCFLNNFCFFIVFRKRWRTFLNITTLKNCWNNSRNISHSFKICF